MELLFENPRAVVCVKPVGLDSEHGLCHALEEALGGKFYPVHRLDQNVGGLMLLARDPQTAAAISREGFSKEYVALVHGTPPEADTWEDLLYKDSRKNKVFVVKRMRNGVKQARLSFTRPRAGTQSLVRVCLHTGRSHQIRVQFSSRGYPLVGDHKYGSRAVQTAPMLFCCFLRFVLEGKEYIFEKLPDWAQ